MSRMSHSTCETDQPATALRLPDGGSLALSVRASPFCAIVFNHPRTAFASIPPPGSLGFVLIPVTGPVDGVRARRLTGPSPRSYGYFEKSNPSLVMTSTSAG